MEPNRRQHKNKAGARMTKTDLADVRFGSPESRSIARNILQPANQRSPLSQDEYDCLYLYTRSCLLLDRPEAEDLKRTPAYVYGQKIRERIWGPLPKEDNTEVETPKMSIVLFEVAFHRGPRAGDILRFEDVQRISVNDRLALEKFIGAWERQIPEMPCPLRMDGEQVFRHASKTHNDDWRRPANDGVEWEEATEFSAEEGWRIVEREAFNGWAKDRKINDLRPSAHCSAVVFLGLGDREYPCRPADES